ncbi:MAG: phytoene/squalene synthase family protein [Sphingomonadales bacterium]|nr:phytoene/squalene synthase family protein [Sphingomonadales bacterium]
MLSLYRDTNFAISRLITRKYSTSFSLGILAFQPSFRAPIYSIYGFVRYADEIVDTFHDYDKALLLDEFRRDTYLALERGISLNPVLDAFVQTVRQYEIGTDLIDAFLDSMAMDLRQVTYAQDSYETYIYGSAEVVGLMCLRVFCYEQAGLYEELQEGARALGAAFQKVNFLRDLKDDYQGRGRTYFPNLNLGVQLDSHSKKEIEKDIQHDFDQAYKAIMRLPRGARIGVLTAYRFYKNLFRKIQQASSDQILMERIRISNAEKAALLCYSVLQHKLT